MTTTTTKIRSNSSLERANPPPRRKSCAACVKAKRRCDLSYPLCSRCAARDIECIYVAKPSGARRLDAYSGSKTSPLGASSRLHGPPEQQMATSLGDQQPALQRAHVMGGGMSGQLHLPQHAYMAPPNLPESLMQAPEPQRSSPDQYLEELNNLSIMSTSGQAPVTSAPFSVDDAALLASSFSSDPFYNLGLPGYTRSPSRFRIAADESPKHSVPEMIYSRLGYARHIIKDAPRSMVLLGQTPWCHARLYADRMPRVMEDAISSCALYLAKNPRNSCMILRTIRSRLRDLLSCNSLVNPTSPLDALANVQAILLYVIICSFDNNLAMRLAVDDAFPVLEVTAMNLLQVLNRSVSSEAADPMGMRSGTAHVLAAAASVNRPWGMFPVNEACTFWQEWLFVESAQRSFTTVFFFAQMQRMFKGITTQKCSEEMHHMTVLTVSAALWEAPDVVAFAKEWALGRHVVVNHFKMRGALDDMKADNLGVFEKIILKTILGPDEYMTWTASQGVLEPAEEVQMN